MFRPCIDLHEGKVKQIVGGTLGDDPAQLRTNFVSDRSAAWYAALYQQDNLRGGHVIMLGSGNDKAWLEAGAAHVIVTSWIFQNDTLDWERLNALAAQVGKERLVLDLSCRRRGADYVVVTHRWQRFTNVILGAGVLNKLAGFCDEFLIHAADVEGLCRGIDSELVQQLADWTPLPLTYAGGAQSLADLEEVTRRGRGRIDLTI